MDPQLKGIPLSGLGLKEIVPCKFPTKLMKVLLASKYKNNVQQCTFLYHY